MATVTSASYPSSAAEERPGVPMDGRPLPFVMRVAAEWVDIAELPRAEDRYLFFRRRAALTGALALTGQGRDICFSDLGVEA